MASRTHGSPGGTPPRSGSLGRGFATVDPERQREVVTGGGWSGEEQEAGHAIAPRARRGKRGRGEEAAIAGDSGAPDEAGS